MICLTAKLDEQSPCGAVLTLTYEQRVKSRLRAVLDDGREVGVFLERGAVLRHGDCLAADDGTRVQVRAARERVSAVVAADPLLLAKACYHLGNRHVALQIESGRLCYQHDHVLDALVRGLGLTVTEEEVPFEPEPGAYGGSINAHQHTTGHDHA